jgi:hypothetical protein
MNAKQTAEKSGKLHGLMGCDRCYASRSQEVIIDVIRPDTGLTWYFGQTLAQVRAEYPDAEEMSVDEFCEWKAARQRTPIAWTPTTEAKFYDMLGAVPPAAMTGGGFLVGEAADHDAGNGRPRYAAFRQVGEAFETANRPMTVEEFREEMAATVAA